MLISAVGKINRKKIESTEHGSQVDFSLLNIFYWFFKIAF